MITLARSSSSTPSFAASSVQTDKMDTCKRFFSKLCGPVEKHVPLPPELSEKPEIILEILHNHNLLVRNIWPRCHFTINSIRYNAPAQTVFALEQPAEASHIEKKVTFTSFDGGVSVLNERRLGSTTLGYCTRWTVTKTTTTSEQYSLKETFAAEDDDLLDLLDLLYRLKDDYHPENTERLVHILHQIANGEVSISDVSEGEVWPLASSQKRCVDTAKLKND